MSLLSKYQDNQKPLFNYNNEKLRSFLNLRELNERFPKQTFVIHAFFINKKSKYGESPVVVIDDYSVNLPQHLTDTVKAMLQDVPLIEAINQRKIAFTIYEYNGKHGTGYSVNWVEL